MGRGGSGWGAPACVLHTAGPPPHGPVHGHTYRRPIMRTSRAEPRNPRLLARGGEARGETSCSETTSVETTLPCRAEGVRHHLSCQSTAHMSLRQEETRTPRGAHCPAVPLARIVGGCPPDLPQSQHSGRLHALACLPFLPVGARARPQHGPGPSAQDIVPCVTVIHSSGPDVRCMVPIPRALLPPVRPGCPASSCPLLSRPAPRPPAGRTRSPPRGAPPRHGAGRLGRLLGRPRPGAGARPPRPRAGGGLLGGRQASGGSQEEHHTERDGRLGSGTACHTAKRIHVHSRREARTNPGWRGAPDREGRHRAGRQGESQGVGPGLGEAGPAPRSCSFGCSVPLPLGLTVG